jgi:ATP-dependent HslUV protease ATP-binding subunit HslU
MFDTISSPPSQLTVTLAGDDLTPEMIVRELDKYIIGQDQAKRVVAIAMRNRWRRQRVPTDLRQEIMPNNIILIGPTGVGKTEIARRLSGLAHAPFVKVEATKFTEVGYVGRDVESIIRELTDLAVSQVRSEHTQSVKDKAEQHVRERLLDLLLPPPPAHHGEDESESTEPSKWERSRAKIALKLDNGELEDRMIELDISEDAMSMMHIFAQGGIEELGVNLQDIFGGMVPKRRKKRKTTIAEARQLLLSEETGKLVDMDVVIKEAIHRTENLGIVFLDEIDKIAGSGRTDGPDVSREGVQRDILPVVEGTSVITKYGIVHTDHILFIGSGAFTVSKPSDLIPELQGRFPIRVELNSLTAKDFVRILTEPQNAMIKQYTALLATESVQLTFTKDAIQEIADTADRVNRQMENIGARRLQTVLTRLLESIMFDAPYPKPKSIRITKSTVVNALKSIVKNEDLTRFIL